MVTTRTWQTPLDRCGRCAWTMGQDLLGEIGNGNCCDWGSLDVPKERESRRELLWLGRGDYIAFLLDEVCSSPL